MVGIANKSKAALVNARVASLSPEDAADAEENGRIQSPEFTEQLTAAFHHAKRRALAEAKLNAGQKDLNTMSAPRFWLIAGPNGAGKSTLVGSELFHDLLHSVHFLNADDRTLQLLQQRGYAGFLDVPPEVLVDAFIEASESIFGELVARLEKGEEVCVETVLSKDKYCPVVDQVAVVGGYFAFVYVALRSPELSAERVANRVRAGGHDVPIDKIRARWRRSLEWLPWFAARASVFWVFDNSNATPDAAPVLIAQGIKGKMRLLAPDAIPEITQALSNFPRLPN